PGKFWPLHHRPPAIRRPDDHPLEDQPADDLRPDGNFMARPGLLDSGLGPLGTAAALFNLAPDADLVLATDPDFTPYASLSTDTLEQRALQSAGVLAESEPDAIVIA